MSKTIFIEPLDVLLFRESKPFTGGEDHLARSVFPPPPSTVYAAIRSHLLSQYFGRFEAFKEEKSVPPELAGEIGSPTTFGTLELRRLLVARKRESAEVHQRAISVELLYPMPSDVAVVKGAGQYVLLKPADVKSADKFPVRTNLLPELRHLWFAKDVHLEAAAGWLTEKGMQRYLADEPDSSGSFFGPGEVIAGNQIEEVIFTREERTGIARDRARRSVREGLLYSVEYLRLQKGVGFFAEFVGTQLLPDSGLINLGGDRRPAHYQPAQVSALALDNIKQRIQEHRQFKLVLVTPALFKHGWRPTWIDEQTLKGSRGNVRVKLVAAALGKPVGIGGFDLVKQFPKPLHRFVPAGSVYFFELLEGDADAAIEAFHERSVSESLETFPETARQGFGHSLIGAW
ncbi:MAG: type III-B CRISPR module-associated protein Cmr3 [Blastocatellia bacterium]|nr:type III-B CRISPR module-associated protein Cmr3 [Blastocatellia bacterium]MCS7157316.1 type III-B CRISPR module-associated protein Cmr3 [Blastocatellia bacterium]MCX7753182.1 type III-B CRISPR module-associated protein Cmr3 [Blastocatellia bacterium]MDW8168219.1 type III-B CRISPR module-associated protein Cmr3 [Acidobacteriota bacterium]MDW8257248.1 type III-B CRISPR module-associated protein Cmr3 [Acidobacteriota bacterium]